jgi:hypothetical protein
MNTAPVIADHPSRTTEQDPLSLDPERVQSRSSRVGWRGSRVSAELVGSTRQACR